MVKENSYLTIQAFMINDLNLKGNELLVYAIIYGFSQSGDNEFSGGLKYLMDWTNSTKQGIIKVLNSLNEKGLIEKREEIKNGIKNCYYMAIIPSEENAQGVVNKVYLGGKQSLPGVVNKVYLGGKQSLPNNINNNINNNIIIKKENKESYDDILNRNISDQSLKSKLIEFIQMRKLIKSPMTNRALELLIKRLTELSNNLDVQLRILDNSILNNWKGIFPLKPEEEKEVKELAQSKSNATDEDVAEFLKSLQ